MLNTKFRPSLPEPMESSGMAYCGSIVIAKSTKDCSCGKLTDLKGLGLPEIEMTDGSNLALMEREILTAKKLSWSDVLQRTKPI